VRADGHGCGEEGQGKKRREEEVTSSCNVVQLEEGCGSADRHAHAAAPEREC
jgi:hypothetical protein